MVALKSPATNRGSFPGGGSTASSWRHRATPRDHGGFGGGGGPAAPSPPSAPRPPAGPGPRAGGGAAPAACGVNDSNGAPGAPKGRARSAAATLAAAHAASPPATAQERPVAILDPTSGTVTPYGLRRLELPA